MWYLILQPPQLEQRMGFSDGHASCENALALVCYSSDVILGHLIPLLLSSMDKLDVLKKMTAKWDIAVKQTLDKYTGGKSGMEYNKRRMKTHYCLYLCHLNLNLKEELWYIQNHSTCISNLQKFFLQCAKWFSQTNTSSDICQRNLQLVGKMLNAG